MLKKLTATLLFGFALSMGFVSHIYAQDGKAIVAASFDYWRGKTSTALTGKGR
jgi:hypothetical protein